MCNGFGCHHSRQIQVSVAVANGPASTASIENLLNGLPKPFDTTSPPTKKKGVRFAPQVDVLGPRLTPASEMTDEEKSDIWLQRADYIKFWDSALATASDVKRSERVTSYTKVILRTYSACKDEEGLDKNLKRFLDRWSTISHSRRGLERLSVPAMGNHRNKRKHMMIQGVVEFQNLIDDDLSSDQKDETIRAYAEQQSSQERSFALAMGEADAFAARSDYRVPAKKRFSSLASIVEESPKTKQLKSTHDAPRLVIEPEASTLPGASGACSTGQNAPSVYNPVTSAIGA